MARNCCVLCGSSIRRRDSTMAWITPVDDNLPVPTVRFATANSTLYPLDAEGGTQVNIAFTEMQEGVPITLYWALRDQQDSPLEAFVTTGSATGSVEVEIAAVLIGRCIGKTVTIWYETAIGDSRRLDLTIEFIKPQDLPAPVFFDAVEYDGGRWLDLRKFRGDARVELKAPPFLAVGQRLWILAVGNEHHVGNFRYQWVFDGHIVRAEETVPGFVFRPLLSREWLADCEDWSSVTLNVAITYDGAPGTEPADPQISLLPANAHELRRTTENLRLGEPEPLPFDDLSDFTDHNWNHWEKGPGAADPRDMVIVNEGEHWYLYNYTYTNQSAGTVLTKDYPSLEPGKSYEFSMDVMRAVGLYAFPRLSVLVNGEACIEPTDITHRDWAWMAAKFTATTAANRVEIVSHVATGSGNDYALDNLRLREV